MRIKKLSLILLIGIPAVVIIYAAILIIATSPISEFSIDKAGVFGDSFGILTSIFSGLAFSGVIITALLQKNELALQRKELSENREEFTKGALAQSRTAQLSALSALLNECDSRLTVIAMQIQDHQKGQKDIFLSVISGETMTDLVGQKSYLEKRKNLLSIKIEEILSDTGIELNET